MIIKSRAVGIIFPNMHDPNIPELTGHRTMASVPFGGRYRLIDFPLSGMVNGGVQNVGVIARENYQSLMDHLGNGREWDLSRKRGGLVIFPPYGREGKVYHGRIEALHSVLDWLERRTEGYVVMSDCDVVANIDYGALLETHRQSGADITLVYEKGRIAEEMQGDNVTVKVNAEGRVTEVRVNDYKKGEQNLSLNTYVAGREYLIGVIRDAMVRGQTHFERDFLARSLKHVHVLGFEFKGYRSRIYDMHSYFDETMRLLEKGSVDALFPEGEGHRIYTKVRDEAPVRYGFTAKVSNSLVADGCIIEGEIENCVIFRGVRVRKGARLKNCVVMQGGDIGPGAQLEYVVADKNVTVLEGQTLRGAASFPVFVAKGSRVI